MRMRTAAAMAACAGLALVGAAPATADSNGARVIEQSGCRSYYWGLTICETLHEEISSASTPSGDTSYEENGWLVYTATWTSGYTYTDRAALHDHQLFKLGETQEISLHFTDTQTTTGYGTCTYTSGLHYASGQWQYDDSNVVCR